MQKKSSFLVLVVPTLREGGLGGGGRILIFPKIPFLKALLVSDKIWGQGITSFSHILSPPGDLKKIKVSPGPRSSVWLFEKKREETRKKK